MSVLAISKNTISPIGLAPRSAGRYKPFDERGDAMRRGTLAFASLCAGLVLGGVSVGIAAIPDSGSGVISACVRSGGSIRVIDYQAGRRCTKYETPLTWNQQGPRGAVGPQGSPGTRGPAGADGTFSCADELRILAAVPGFAIRPECAPAPVVVFDNLGTYSGGPSSAAGVTGTSYGNPPGYNDVAAGFDVSSAGNVALDTITMRLRQQAGPNLTVSLVGDRPLTGSGTSDATGEPDLTTVIEQWSLSVTSGYPTDYTVNSVSHPVLQAGRRYWVVLAAAEPATYVFWNVSPMSSSGQLQAERNQLYISWGYSPTAWFSKVVQETQAMKVVGTAA